MVRHHGAAPVDPQTLVDIAHAVTRGPTAGNSQGITVVLVTEREGIDTIAFAAGEADFVRQGRAPWLSSAAAHLVICAEPGRYLARYSEQDKEPAALDGVPWWWVDGGAALMTALLAAVDSGLTAGFLGGHRLDPIREVLGIPDDVAIVGLVTLGPAPDSDQPTTRSLRRGRRVDAVRAERW